jgi:hypothetical protein
VTRKKTDELRLIKGIAPAQARRLREGGIVGLPQLAAASPAKIAALVPGLSAERVVRLGWTQQARKLVSGSASKRRRTAAVRRGQQRYATFTVELLVDDEDQVRRTRVTHIQSGGQEAWAGWEQDRLVALVRRRAGLATGAPGQVAPAETALRRQASPPAPPVLGGAVRLSGLEAVAATGETRQVWRPGETFIVRLRLDLSGVTDASDCLLECWVAVRAKLLGGPHWTIGEARDTTAVRGGRDLAIAATADWPPGLYRLDALASVSPRHSGLLEPSKLTAALSGGLLQISDEGCLGSRGQGTSVPQPGDRISVSAESRPRPGLQGDAPSQS